MTTTTPQVVDDDNPDARTEPEPKPIPVAYAVHYDNETYGWGPDMPARLLFPTEADAKQAVALLRRVGMDAVWQTIPFWPSFAAFAAAPERD